MVRSPIVFCGILVVGVLGVAGVGQESATDAVPRAVLRVALLQLDARGNDRAYNLDKAERFCRMAAAEGADIALMAEMWDIGYTRFDPEKEGDREAFWAQAVPTSDASIQRFARLAQELDMAIAVGYEQAWDPLPRNAVTLFDRHGKEVFTYAKVHTSDFKPLETSMTPGEDFYVGELDTRVGPVQVGAMICFDREQPESARILMLKGAEVILTPNCCGLDDIRLQQFRIRAVENQVCVAMANYPRPYQNGHSVAYNERGECMVMADEDEGLYMATFDLDELRRRRRRSIWGNAYRRPHRYGILVDTGERDAVWQRKDGYGQPWTAEGR